MPITTKTTYTLGGITYGCSDTCATLYASGNLTVSELARFSWCRWEDKYLDCVSSTNVNVGSEQGAAIFSLLSQFQTDGNSYLTTKYVKDRVPTKKPYCFNILLYGNGGDTNITSNNASDYRVVTSCSDFQSLYVQVDEYNDAYTTESIQFPTARTINTNCLTWSRNAVYNTNSNTYTDYITVWTVLVIDETHFFITKGAAFTGQNPCGYNFGNMQYNIIPSAVIKLYNNTSQNTWRYYNSDITDYSGNNHLIRWCSNDFNIDGTVTWDDDVRKNACWDVTDDISVAMYGYWHNYNYSYFLRTENAVKTEISYMGLRWKYAHGDTGHIYTPIIDADGYITGYSTDPNAETKLKDIIDVTGNNIPPLPPVTPTGEVTDHETNMPWAYIGGTAGMVQFIKINSSGLASADDISAALSRFDISTIGKDLLRNFVSFKCFAALNIDPNDTVTRQITIAGHGLEDENNQPLNGQVIGSVKPIDLFGTSHGVTIPTLYNDYRDYLPYTKIQMYVPFCGWFDLPPWCIGKKITGTMFTDLYNGTVKAIIYASQTVVAEVGGCCAYDIPFVADATGAKAGAVISSALSTAAATAATVAMPNVATGIAAVSSAANLAASLNGNDTTLKGVLGDGSNLNGLLNVYIKVTRPKPPNGAKNIPDSYKHEIGIPTMKEVTINAGDGYIQVMDAKINGTMTAREKQMIIDGFRHGLNF